MSEATQIETRNDRPATAGSEVVLSVRDVTVAFGDNVVLENLSLDVRRGEILGFVGASGAGKSVLLRTVLGLNKKRSGTIELFGVDLDKATEAERLRLDMRVGVLVFPRLVALVVALPCLSILANFAALGGGIAVSWFYSDIAPIQFIDRLRIAIDTSTIFAGLIKAPFMALIIGIIGAVEGLKVGGSTESLGSHVTASVVKSIFVVIILDGAFAIFYAAIDF